MVLRLKAWESKSLPSLQKGYCWLYFYWIYFKKPVHENLNPGLLLKNNRALLVRSLINDAGWSSPVARQAHNLKVVGSNPTPATN